MNVNRILTPQVRAAIIALAVALAAAAVELLTGALSAAGGTVPMP